MMTDDTRNSSCAYAIIVWSGTATWELLERAPGGTFRVHLTDYFGDMMLNLGPLLSGLLNAVLQLLGSLL